MASQKDNSVIQDEPDKADCVNKPMGTFQIKGHHARQLNCEELSKLERDTNLVKEFKQQKLEKEAQRNWDIFYKRNTTKFFKDRHWTTREFKDLCGQQNDGSKLVILEVGCGVGNFLFPLLEDSNLFFYACDFSPRAVQFVKDNPLYKEDRCHAFQCDLTQDLLTMHIPANSVDIVTMIFVLSAIHPDKMLQVLENIATVLKPGGSVLIRDYGLYDHAMLRFAPGHKLSDNFYVRQDGTRAYYFSEEKLAELFIRANFGVASNEYLVRETINRKEGLCVPRVFVQGKFVKEKGAFQDCLKYDVERRPMDPQPVESSNSDVQNSCITNSCNSTLYDNQTGERKCSSCQTDTCFGTTQESGCATAGMEDNLANLNLNTGDKKILQGRPVPRENDPKELGLLGSHPGEIQSEEDIAIETAEKLIVGNSIKNNKNNS